MEIARDFVITNRATGEEIKRDDFKNKILFLDFFAYWCSPCNTSSPEVEEQISEYYKKMGGNLHGVEVVVIGVNIESSNPAATDQFVSNVGFKTVADDFGSSGGAWAQFGAGGIPHFVVMNGTAGGSHQQWEVLHSGAGFSGAGYYRGIIDTIEPGSQPEIRVEQPTGVSLKDGAVTKSFGKKRVGSKATKKTFTIRNTGKATLNGLRIVRSGRNRKDFKVSRLSSTSLEPGEKMTFKVRFSPKGKGNRIAKLKIRSNDANENPFDIRLRGRGVK